MAGSLLNFGEYFAVPDPERVALARRGSPKPRAVGDWACGQRAGNRIVL
jgi:hypothetical protein